MRTTGSSTSIGCSTEVASFGELLMSGRAFSTLAPCTGSSTSIDTDSARDGALLIENGYRLTELRPVGQFRWSTHVELASLFVRG